MRQMARIFLSKEREHYDWSQIGRWSFPFPGFYRGTIIRGYSPVSAIWFSIAAVFWNTIAGPFFRCSSLILSIPILFLFFKHFTACLFFTSVNFDLILFGDIFSNSFVPSAVNIPLKNSVTIIVCSLGSVVYHPHCSQHVGLSSSVFGSFAQPLYILLKSYFVFSIASISLDLPLLNLSHCFVQYTHNLVSLLLSSISFCLFCSAVYVVIHLFLFHR